jgi:hypothetical protein
MLQIPVIINNRDRLTSTFQLVHWLLQSGSRDITILDNDSAYPPLLQWYKELHGTNVSVRMMRRNLGSQALWARQNRDLVQPPFVYTDSDIVPAPSCPKDLIQFLLRTALACSHRLKSSWNSGGPIQKIGPGFMLSDLPACYEPRPLVLAWEQKHCGRDRLQHKHKGVDLHDAAIDTTFALYLNDDPFGLAATRTGAPYLVRHLPWYTDSNNPSEEDVFYEGRADKRISNWCIKTCTSHAVQREFAAAGSRKIIRR